MISSRRKFVLPDIIKQNLTLLICGYNPGRHSCLAGHYFANQTHRFWKTLQWAGFTDGRILVPSDDTELLSYRIGLTDLLKNTRHGDKVKVSSADRERLTQLVADCRPKIIAFLGKRPASEYMSIPRRRIQWGLTGKQIEGARIAVMPDPSPANGHFEKLRYHWRVLCEECKNL
jgi:double-stranded uracil-DNA glycosylase